MIIVHYEVYVLEGRGWMLHARFPRTERETAVNEAKELEQTLNVRVKVLRETYYTDDNVFEEAEVYVSGGKGSDKQRPSPPRPSAPSTPSRSSSSSAPSQPARSQPARRPPAPPPRRPAPAAPPHRQRSPEEVAKARQVFARLFAIVAVALAAALLGIKITPNAIMLLWKMGFVIAVTPETYGQLLFAVFVLTFLMVAVPLAIRFMPRKTQLPVLRRPSLSWGSGRAPHQSADPERDRALKKSLDKLASKALAEEGHRDEKAAEPELPDIPMDDLPEILPGRPDEDLPEIRPDPQDVMAEMEAKAKKEREKQEEARKAKDEPPKDEQKKEEKKADNAASPESLQPAVMRFLNGAVNSAKTVAPNMDAYTKFALHLYLAGAVETLCEFKKQGDVAKAKLVEMALETLGTKGDLARKFYDKLEEYLLEPRYLGVVQAGRTAMGDFMLGDEAGAHAAMRDVFLQWNRKSDKKAQIVTVMFTDMVGSTDLTQARGDAAAQEVVRRHNGIVRGALAQYGGKEIKHTGDGIMASFGTAAAAVEATVSIQRQVSQHNHRMPNLGLSLRIGLNAGEPIEEEDDLFGSTVQLAARVCAATNADQTLCTGVVKDLAAGKGATVFRHVGDKYLKGFKEAVPLFEVVWNE